MARSAVRGIVTSLLAMLCATNSQASKNGLSKQDLVAVAQVLPEGAQVTAMRLFYGSHTNAQSVALQAAYQRGWKIFVFSHNRENKWVIEWKSTRLPDSFAVASTEGLRTSGLNGEQGITFSGCAPHMCPDVFSALLYVPSRKKAFVATCNGGHTAYSFPEGAGTQPYRTALDELLHQHSGSDRACSPFVH